jgi:tetratricopeptide (TPR) repeat protein
MRPMLLRLSACGMATVLVLLGAACGSEADDLLTRALAAHAEGDLDTAERLYGEVLDDEPKNVFAHYNIGLIHQTRGKKDAAVVAYGKALEADPNFVPALFNLAVVRSETAPGEAIELYRGVISLQPDYAAAHLNLGFLLKANGKAPEGEKELKKAVELDPTLSSRIPASPRPAGPATPAP